MSGGGGDADGILNVAVPLLTVGGGRHTVVGHQADGVVDGVHENADVLHHRDAVFPLRRLAEQLLDVQIGRPGIHPAFGNRDKGFAPAVLRQALRS